MRQWALEDGKDKKGPSREASDKRMKVLPCSRMRGKMNEEIYYYWLSNIPGIGRETMKKLLTVTALGNLYEKGAKEDHPLSPRQRQSLEEHRRSRNPEAEWKKLQNRGIRFLCPVSRDYPKKLKNIPDPPLTLYEKGRFDCMDRPAVAIVGARSCSAYGSLAAKELGRALAAEGIVVISGMARGIDGISQWAALEQGGISIGVLGSGVEVCYPKENRRLYERLGEKGCLLSESPPYTGPKAGLFPLRNRLISGLADVLVVIEAKEKSGTLITVDMALEQGKEVYAMPGRITDSLSCGCNKLIRQGAGVLLSPREFAQEMGEMLLGKKRREILHQENRQKLTPDEKTIYTLLEPLPLSVETLWQKGRQQNPSLTLAQVMQGLLILVMKGMAATYENCFFVK